MRPGNLEQALKQALQTSPDSGRGLEKTLLLAASAAKYRRRRERISFGAMLWQQVRYIGWPFWCVQMGFLLAFDRTLAELYGERFWDSPTAVARLLLCASTLVAMMALPLLHRSRKYRMQEMEGATYFSSAKVLMAKLAVIGLGDGLLLAGLFWTAMVRTSVEAGSLGFCLMLPFLVMCAAYLYLMGHCGGDSFFWGSVTLGIAMLLLAVVFPGQWLLSRPGMRPGWLAVCLGLLIFSAGQLRYLLCRSPYAELQVS